MVAASGREDLLANLISCTVLMRDVRDLAHDGLP